MTSPTFISGKKNTNCDIEEMPSFHFNASCLGEGESISLTLLPVVVRRLPSYQHKKVDFHETSVG